MLLKKNNIAEYILYLWQIEDYLRAFPQQADANQELHDLSEMMHQENIMEVTTIKETTSGRKRW